MYSYNIIILYNKPITALLAPATTASLIASLPVSFTAPPTAFAPLAIAPPFPPELEELQPDLLLRLFLHSFILFLCSSSLTIVCHSFASGSVPILLNFSSCQTRLRHSSHWAHQNLYKVASTRKTKSKRKQVLWAAHMHENVSTPPKVAQDVTDSCGTFHPHFVLPSLKQQLNTD